MKKQIRKKDHWIRNDFFGYTICFLFVAFGSFFYYFFCGKSFIFAKDGLQQHFTALLYERNWLRYIFSTLWEKHQLEIPLWDMTIGYGSDILTTLHYYGITDPLTFFVALLPKQSMVENFYHFLIILRIYLSGSSFLFYCHTRKRRGIPAICGTLIYCFSLWTIVGIRHPFFLTPLIYFPLILVGMNRIFERKTPYLYMISLTLMCISNFYFTYMICILVIGYGVWKYFVIEKKLKWNIVFYWINRFFLYSLTALLTACFILFPVIFAVFDIERVHFSVYVPIFYSLQYYIGLLAGYLTGSAGAFWTYLGYTGFGVFALWTLFLGKRDKKQKVLWLIFTLLLLFPIAGHIMNGFSYVVNRYVFGYTMLVSFFVVSKYPYFVKTAKQHKRILLLMICLYSIFCILLGIVSKRKIYCVQVICFVVMVFLIFSYQKIKNQKIFDMFMCNLLCISLIAQGYCGVIQYCGGKQCKDFAIYGTAEASMTTQCMAHCLKQIEDMSIYRYDHWSEEEKRNSSMALGLRGLNYYFSMTNGYINRFQRSVYLNLSRDYRYAHVDGRGMLDALMSVKYYLTKKECLESDYPNQFSEIITGNTTQEEVSIRKTEDFLPFGFTSDSFISEQTYQKLTPEQRQQSLLQSIVVKKSSLPEANLEFSLEKLNIKKETMTGLKWDKKQKKIIVEQKKGKITFCFDGLPNSETYLVFKNLDYKDTNTKTWLKEPIDNTKIKIIYHGKKTFLDYRNHRNNFYSNLHDFMVNLGYRTKKGKKITMEFPEKGIYTYDDFYIVSQPMKSIHTMIQEMSKDSLQKIQFSTNQIIGDINLEKRKLLCITIPYSKGWKAYIDGKKAEVLQADIGFLALEIPKGSHKIVWKYQTPYLKLGISFTILGILLWIGIYFLSILKIKKEGIFYDNRT